MRHNLEGNKRKGPASMQGIAKSPGQNLQRTNYWCLNLNIWCETFSSKNINEEVEADRFIHYYGNAVPCLTHSPR